MKILPEDGLQQFDQYGHAPIHFVQSCKMLEILINHGIDIDTKTQDKASVTLLQLSIKSGNNEVRDCLLEAKANIEIEDSHKRTPIVNCIEEQDPECVKKILPLVDNK